jgi:hypothetical protein
MAVNTLTSRDAYIHDDRGEWFRVPAPNPAHLGRIAWK